MTFVCRTGGVHQQDSRAPAGAERALSPHVPPGAHHRPRLRARQDTEHITRAPLAHLPPPSPTRTWGTLKRFAPYILSLTRYDVTIDLSAGPLREFLFGCLKKLTEAYKT